MNTHIFDGVIVRDPVRQKVTENQVSVTNFTLAVRSPRKAKNSGEMVNDMAFHDCEVWEKAADYIAENCKKGDALLVQATTRTDTWEKDGAKRSKLKFRVTNFQRITYGVKSSEGNTEVVDESNS